jgi:Zn-dependent peptidase ImmA (M78 family)
MSRKALARKAASEALRVRLRAGIALTDPVNAIDIAEKLGIQVWFQRLPSVEGVLIRAPHPVILLSSVRPAGRMAFTCAHELGHYWFNHAGHIDVVDDGPVLREDSDDEYQANMFASYLLMPKTTVQHGFAQRHATPENAAPLTVLAISHWLGVGYSTLVYHLRFNLNLISDTRTQTLLRHGPKDIVGPMTIAREAGTAVFVVDRAWRSRAVDLEVGDVVILDSPIAASGECIQIDSEHGTKVLAVAVRPGTGHLDGWAGWATYVRVRRSRFEGRSIFRHLEETDDE